MYSNQLACRQLSHLERNEEHGADTTGVYTYSCQSQRYIPEPVVYVHNCNETTLIPGRYDLADAEHVCIKCKTPMRLAHPHGLLREELWPGSAGKRSQYMFDQDMFLFFDLLQKNFAWGF